MWQNYVVVLPQYLASKKAATSSKSAAASSKSTTTKGFADRAGGKVKGTATGGGGGGKQKRSPWDLKGRLQDMEALMADERKFSSNTIGELQTQVSKQTKYSLLPRLSLPPLFHTIAIFITQNLCSSIKF